MRRANHLPVNKFEASVLQAKERRTLSCVIFRLIDVSRFLSNYIPVICHIARSVVTSWVLYHLPSSFILSYLMFLFVWLNFQLDKSEFGEHKSKWFPRKDSSNSLIGVRQIDTETDKFSSWHLQYVHHMYIPRMDIWALGLGRRSNQ